MPKTAKEMFEELGLELEENPVFKDWIMYGGILNGEIIFDLTYKHAISNMSISPKIHLAIHQQLKELGWLDE